jgi:hypothetical protein
LRWNFSKKDWFISYQPDSRRVFFFWLRIHQIVEGQFQGTVVSPVPLGAGPAPRQPHAKKKAAAGAGGKETGHGLIVLDVPSTDSTHPVTP